MGDWYEWVCAVDAGGPSTVRDHGGSLLQSPSGQGQVESREDHVGRTDVYDHERRAVFLMGVPHVGRTDVHDHECRAVTHPNPGEPCRGDGSDPTITKICDEFPMFLKVDYVRLYQDLGDDRDADNLMQLSCDPPSHPTREWILGHIDEYQDWDSPVKDVAGGAYCTIDDDCTIGTSNSTPAIRLTTGQCEKSRCKCTHGDSWGGPRCTTAMRGTQYGASKTTVTGFGPPMELAIAMAALVVLLTTLSVWQSNKKEAAEARARAKAVAMTVTKPLQVPSPNDGIGPAKVDYNRNFVERV